MSVTVVGQHTLADMNMPTISTSAAQAREHARRPDGRFGEQRLSEVEFDSKLDDTPSEHVTMVNPIFSEVEKKERSKAMLAKLDEELDKVLLDPERLRELMRFAARFRRYSARNSALIQMQCPNATHVASRNAWMDAGGHLRKGAKAIWVLAPATYRQKVTDEHGQPVIDVDSGQQKVVERMYFRDVPVYDISDVEGVEVPKDPWGAERLEGQAPERMIDDLSGVLDAQGYALEFAPIPGSANGFTSPSGRRVVIDSGLSNRQQALTLAHELGHIRLGHVDRDIAHYRTHRGEMENEAQAVANLIAYEYGMDDAGRYGAGYMVGWANGDREVGKKAALKVIDQVRQTLEECHPSWQPEPIAELVAQRQARQQSRTSSGSRRRSRR